MIDNKDRQILNLLQENSRATASEIAQSVGLSVPAVTERIHKLQEKGIIKGFSTDLDAKKLGYDLSAFIAVDSSSSEHYEDIVTRARANPAIRECHSITGEGSHLLKLRLRNSSELESQLREIQSWPGVIRTHTMLVLSTYKEHAPLDIREIADQK